jgi:ribonuclease HI
MTYHVDGFAIADNPSPIGGGYTIIDENGELVERWYEKKKGMTNNEVELRGLFVAAAYVRTGDTIITDRSNSLVLYCAGKSKARPDINPTIIGIHRRLAGKTVFVKWWPREEHLAGRYNEKHKFKLR